MTEIDSEIDSVTVYRQGALVSRLATLNLESGPTQIKIRNLPLCLEDGSVRAEVVESSDDSVVARRVHVILELPTAQPDLPPASPVALLEARREERILRDRLQFLESLSSRMEALSLPERPRPVRGQAPSAFDLEGRLKLSAFRAERLELLANQQKEVQAELHNVTQRRLELEQRNARESNARQPQLHEMCKALVVDLDAPLDFRGTVRFRIEYRVPGARWAPSYILRIAPDFSRARLEIQALVCQRSRENWNGVKLRLSTADPLAWVELPELKSRRIGRRQSEPQRLGWRPPTEGIEELFADFDRAFPRPTKRMMQLEPADPEELAASGLGPALRDAPVAQAAAPAPAAPPRHRAGVRAKMLHSVSGIADREAGEELSALLDEPLPDEQQMTPPAKSYPKQNYDRLRMLPPNEWGRGQLTILQEEDIYLEMVFRFTFREPLIRVLSAAREEAMLHRLGWPAGFRPPERQASFDYAFAAEAPVAIASDDHFHYIPLGSLDVPPRLSLISVPREDQSVYRTLRLRNMTNAPWLEGPVDVYLEDRYMLTSTLRDTPENAEFELGLGIEQRVRISRNVTFEEQNGGVMPGRQQLRHRITLEVASHLPHDAELEVRERLPVTEKDDKEVEVTLDRVDPAWQPFDQRGAPVKGAYRWMTTLSAGQTRTFEAVYTIHLANKNEVVGGNRRDT